MVSISKLNIFDIRPLVMSHKVLKLIGECNQLMKILKKLDVIFRVCSVVRQKKRKSYVALKWEI